MSRFLKGGPTPDRYLSRFFVHSRHGGSRSLIGLAGCISSFLDARDRLVHSEDAGRAGRRDRLFFSTQIWKDVVGWRWSLPASVRWPSGSRWSCWKRRRLIRAIITRNRKWYFLFLFQHLRLKMFSGEFGQFLGSMLLQPPGGVLVLLPFSTGNPERNIQAPFCPYRMVVLIVSILLFTVSAIINRDIWTSRMLKKSQHRSRVAQRLNVPSVCLASSLGCGPDWD